MRQHEHTRRRVLQTGAAALVTMAGIGTFGTAAANPGRGDEQGNGKSFGAVYANDDLWRTHVVRVLDERPEPDDLIYFLHDGEQPIVANGNVSPDQASPFVSESAPGDQDWNGGKWTHVNALVTDIDAFNDDAPFTNDQQILDADYIETNMGRPTGPAGMFGPPEYFICPLNGRV